MFVSTFNWEELSKRGWIPTRKGYSLIWVKWAVKRSTDKTVLGGTVLGGYLVWSGGFSKSVIFTSVERSWSPFTASQLPVCIVLYLCWTVTQSGTTQINWEESFFDVYLAKSMLVVFFFFERVRVQVRSYSFWGFESQPLITIVPTRRTISEKNAER